MRAEMLRATALSSRSSLQQERLFERERKTGLDHRLEDTKVITKYGSGFTKMLDREKLIQIQNEKLKNTNCEIVQLDIDCKKKKSFSMLRP